MSSSIGNSSALNLALLNQLLQRAGAETDTGATSESGSGQSSNDAASFSSQADALFNAFDTDGDGKLSKSELRTGFQNLSQDMRSVLIGQQAIGSGGAAGDMTAAALSSLDRDGDGAIEESEFAAGLSAGTSAAESWLQRMQTSSIGDVANQQAMNSLQQSIKLDQSLSQLLQATDIPTTGAATGTL